MHFEDDQRRPKFHRLPSTQIKPQTFALCEEAPKPKCEDYHKVGVIITNLGTPEAPTSAGVRDFLAEFLHDHRVVDTSRWKWCPILHGIILRFRPKKVAKLYQSVWTPEGAPMMAICKRQRAALEVELERRFKCPVKVVLAMRYGNPSVKDGFKEIDEAELRRVVVLPLYPQYASPTTASTMDAVAKALKEMRGMPDMRFIHHYHDNPSYIKNLADSIRSHWAKHGKPEKLLFSFHGIPVRYHGEGDFYNEHCDETSEAVAAELGLEESQWHMTYQSVFGKEEWLDPKTDKTLEAWGEQGMGRVDVICPGFSADCLETLEEIGKENRDAFVEAGGKDLLYIPALNDDANHISTLADIIEEEMRRFK